MTSLVPRLGFVTTVSVIVGTMIGSGIFKKSAPMALLLGSEYILITVWIVAGIITLLGALCNAEVASVFPSTGGQYVFFKKMYGDKVAYIYGWAIFTVIQTGSIASIAYIFSEYLISGYENLIVAHSLFTVPFVGLTLKCDVVNHDILVRVSTIMLIVLLTAINHMGAKTSGRLAVLFTSIKVLSIILIICLAFWQPFQNVSVLEHSSVVKLSIPAGIALIFAVMAALSKAFWAYDGWNSITYIAGEVKNAQRNIPKALILGVVAVTALYVLVNVAYLNVLPISVIAKSNLVAADVMNHSIGTYGSAAIGVVVMLSTLGATNNTILSSARAHFALASDNLFFKSIGTVHPKYNTPHISLWIQCVWSSVLVLSGTFETLTDMLIFVSWIFYGMSAYGVILLRKTLPHIERPYKVPFYPVIPLTFVSISILFLVFVLWGDIDAYIKGTVSSIPSLSGLLLTMSGMPLYYWFDKKRKQQITASA
ncbi:MAG: amino acid permease [Candidatus Kapabacteria bacterium]|nr:amino acid permease [Candidatus Kapabacteria bacterium]